MTNAETATAAEQAEPVTPDSIMQLGTAFWGSKTLLSAVELRLFGVLSEAGPLRRPRASRATRPAPAQRKGFLRRTSGATHARP